MRQNNRIDGQTGSTGIVIHHALSGKVNNRCHGSAISLWIGLCLIFVCMARLASAQSAGAEAAPVAGSAAILNVIRWNGSLPEAAGRTVEIRFGLYQDQAGGQALWRETQAVSVGADGKYSVLLGAASPDGLPLTLFQAGEARWIEAKTIVTSEGPSARDTAQARLLLAAVPYALKAVDAETLAGREASDYVTREDMQAAVAAGTSASAQVHPDVSPAGSGTTGFVPLWTGTSNLGNSVIAETGTSVGIDTATPATTLDVNGTTTLRGKVSIPTTTVATASAGVNSPPLTFTASSFKSGGAATAETMAWEAVAAANNTASPSANMTLLYSSGTGGLQPTGLSILTSGSIYTQANIRTASPAATASTGYWSSQMVMEANAYNSSTHASVPQQFAFASMPTGNNTASPSANLELMFGTTATAATGLSFAPTGVISFAPGQTFPGTGTITGVTAGTGLTGGGAAGAVTLGLDTTMVPLLGAANNSFSGSLSATGAVNASTYDLNGALFAYGNRNGNSFLGFAGNGSVPTSIDNTAVGYEAMTGLTGGDSNTAVGANALDLISTGVLNTALGAFSGADSSNLSDSTAIGANAVVSQNDSLVLGQDTDGSPGKTYVNVGIGTSVPASELELSKFASDALGPVLTLTNPAGDGASAAIDFKTYLHASTAHSPTARIWAIDDNNYGTDLLFQSKEPGSDSNPLQTNMAIFANGQVTMGTLSQESPYEGELQNAQLTVQGQNGFDGVVGVGSASVQGAPQGGIGGIFAGGSEADGVWGISGSDEAGFFQGDVFVNGILQASTKNFKIDHPTDPANKYMVHSSVESSEMMNIYSGNVVTDKLGLATVKLPEWFEAENGDFRYQLTTIGRDAHAWVAEEVAHNQFKIATNATFVKVSWQITAVRQDAYAKAHPLVVEVTKPDRERGYYVHPELYGQPEEKGIAWARNAKVMQQIKARREADEKRRAQVQK